MDHGEEARRLFMMGYNCAQSVFCAFRDETGLSLDESARLSSSFGGGMGRLREVCGGVSGALMALGAICGYDVPGDDTAKRAHYKLVQNYARRFKEMNGTIVCRELLRDVPVTPGDIPEARTPEYYARRPCLRLVGEAAALLDEMLNEMRQYENMEVDT
ncbi:MAG: C_GCAxxG_C_C family protein [Lachnospiraceae bacterium]|jgi:C_GCAxxG_C_C family probable redox protein|nr:C_GCAxxG_C_C family protein [Lachnospiraceae bacterium]